MNKYIYLLTFLCKKYSFWRGALEEISAQKKHFYGILYLSLVTFDQKDEIWTYAVIARMVEGGH